MTPDEARDELAAQTARLDQAKAQVLDDMTSEPNPEQLDGFLLELEEEALRLRERAGRRYSASRHAPTPVGSSSRTAA
jgi:hypothetical protein